MTISFKGAHFPKDVILHAVFFYLRYGVSYRDPSQSLPFSLTQTSDQNRFFCPFVPAIECLKMSIINHGHYQALTFTVRAGTPDGYRIAARSAKY